jgi:hypothetical protein
VKRSVRTSSSWVKRHVMATAWLDQLKLAPPPFVLRVVPNGKVEGLWCYACRLPKLFTSRRNDESDPESKLFGGVPEPLKCLLTG